MKRDPIRYAPRLPASARRHPRSLRRTLAAEPLELRLLLAASFSFDAPSGNGADDFTLLFNAADDQYEIRDSITDKLLAKRKHTNGLGDVEITGADGEGDTLRIDASFFSEPLPVSFDGDSGGPDSLIVAGSGSETAIYTPTAGTAGDGTLQVDGTSISFAGLEPVTVSGMDSLSVVTPGSEDDVTIDTATGPGGEAANIILGTSDGVAFESITFFDVTDVTLDTATNDAAAPDDTVLFVDDLSASGLGSLTVDLGGGDDDADASAVSSIGVTLVGGAGDDLLDDGAAAAPLGDLLLGGADNDTLISLQGGNDTLDGGTGNDLYVPVPGSTITVSDPGGDDEVDFGAGMMMGGGGGGAAMAASLFTLEEEQGIDLMVDDGDCLATDQNGGVVICDGQIETFDATDGPDVITIENEESDVTVNGGMGSDEYHEQAGDVTVVLNDPLPPGMELSLLQQTGQNGGDDIYHFEGSTATVNDDGGDDEVDFGMFMMMGGGGGGGGGAEAAGLAALATLSVGECTVSGLCIEVTDGGLTAVSGDGVLFVDFSGTVETVIGSDFDDDILLLTSAGTATVARGLSGDDLIDSGPGSDTLDGGAGNDTMNGGTGDDTFVQTNLSANPGTVDEMSDGGGLETIDFSGSDLGVNFDLKQFGALVVDAAANVVNLVGSAFLENVIATNFNDKVVGSDVANFISTLDGNDRIVGSAGFDVLIGGDGADRITGSSGQDLIISGFSDFDTNDEALRAILAEWTSGADLATRVQNLRDGSVTLSDGTAVVLEKGVTVFDDDDADMITASNGPDWIFFDELLDTVTDLDEDEDVINDGPVP